MIRVRSIGQNVIEVRRRVIRPDAEFLFATLLYLCAERGRHVQRETIARLLWPRESTAKRRHSLRQILYKLRQLGVPTGGTAVSLILSAKEVSLDFEELETDDEDSLIRELGAAGGARCLPTYAPRLSKQFNEWLDNLRARAESVVRRRIVAAITSARRAGHWERVESLARNCLQLDPLNEEAILALAESTALAGAKHRAVELLDAYVLELGPRANDVKLPATLLRRRISENIPPRRLRGPIETRLVGREDVMTLLTQALDTMKAGHASAHLLWGAPGIGKTRVLEEVATTATLFGAGIILHRASPDDRHTPGLSLVRLARTMLDAPGALGLTPDVLALFQRLTAHAPDPQTELEVSEDALVRALVDLERSLAWERPLLLIVDDLHHADEMSQRILSRAHGCLTSERALLLMASVPEPPGTGMGRINVHRLGRLSADASARLAAAFLEKTDSARDERAIEALATASGGHPFVLREAVIASLRRRDTPPDATIEGMLQQRVANLSEEARDTLLSAILLGEHAAVPLLFESSQLPPAAVENGLVELDQEQVLQIGIDARVSVHSLWQSAIATLFPASRIATRRLAIGRLLEDIAHDQGQNAELLLASGLQFQRGGDATRAARVLARGGTALHERGLASSAFATLERAATLAPMSEDFERLLFAALRAASQGQLIDETTTMLAKFGTRLRRSQRLTITELGELDVIEVEAKQTALDLDRDLVQRCIESARRDDLGSDLRLRAALAGARVAEQLQETLKVRELAEIASRVERSDDECESLGDQIAIVAAVASRRLDEARTLAERQVEASGRVRPQDRCRTLLSARVPFWFDCDFVRVQELVRAARQSLGAYPSSYFAVRTEDIHATLCIEMMEIDEASRSLDNALELARDYGYGSLERETAEATVRLAIARRLAPTMLDELFLTTLDRVERSRTSRSETFALCNAAVMSARAGRQDLLVRILPYLTALWSVVLRGCPFDYPCVALAVALTSSGRRNEALKAIDSYLLDHRVATHSPSPFVAELAREFDLPLN